MLTQVTLEDILPISIGAGILGTGGGGSPYLESLHLRNTIHEKGPARVLDPLTLDNDARVVVVGCDRDVSDGSADGRTSQSSL